MTPVRQSIKLHWDTIKGYIEEAIGESKERPEDVYASCIMGHAELYYSKDGFMIVTERINAFDEQKEMFIWFAGSFVLGKSVLLENIDWVKQLAATKGCSRVAFSTHRRGMEKLLQKHCRYIKSYYEIEV